MNNGTKAKHSVPSLGYGISRLRIAKYLLGMNVQSEILKEKFPHLKDKIISADNPESYTENGKVVGLISDFGAVKFIMYTNPKQNQILKTRFIFE